MKIKVLLTALIILNTGSLLWGQSEEKVQLKEGWKFRTGDNLSYADQGYDDSKWVPIQVDKNWENQGYEKLDGYAWYRIKIVIPSALKEKAYLQDSLELFMGKINNYDQCYINGKIFGINGKNVPLGTIIDTSFITAPVIMWDYTRRYCLSADDPRILWDKENVIAVRVFDQGGLGGIYTGNLFIGMVNIKEYLNINYDQIPFYYQKNSVSKTFAISNSSDKLTLKGIFRINADSKIDGKTLYKKEEAVELKPNSRREFSFELKNQDHSNSIKYIFEFSHNKEQVTLQEETPYLLTPKESDAPRINGAKVYGERKGKPLLYKIAATGVRPISFAAVNLPDGLTVDKKRGIIRGSVKENGDYRVTLIAKNKVGSAQSELIIRIGNEIALTPPMGWNSWNAWGISVDQQKVLSSAKAYTEKGLANHGWNYINIDDGWEIVGTSKEPKRNSKGSIICNEKFPDMKALGDSLHANGLKFGIYSSPGPLTCGGYTATYQHELQDVQTFASWGVDYLKYDWCSYDKIAKDTSRAECIKPYKVMQEALSKVDRDIVYSLCQYGMSNVWEWGESVSGNLWRTTEDINDSWESMKEIGFSQTKNARYAKPGHWNDPDMLVVGWVGWGPSLHPTKLTPDEQYTHISLWSLLSAPLLIGCDLTKLDPFTLNLLTNDEVIAIDQDPLGNQAEPVMKKGSIEVWKKKLQDGGYSIGIFNLGASTEKYTLNFQGAGLKEKLTIRNVWKQQNLGKFKDNFETVIPSHGVVLLRLLVNK